MLSDSLWKLFAIIICVILLFIVPMKMSYARQDKIIDNLVRIEVESFSQQVRELGYVNQFMLKDFRTRLNATGLEYELSIEHLSKSFATDASGGIKAYYDGVYEDDIYIYLESNTDYSLRIGDFVFIEVESKSLTKTQSLNLMFGVPKGPGIFYRSGGIVRYGNG